MLHAEKTRSTKASHAAGLEPDLKLNEDLHCGWNTKVLPAAASLSSSSEMHTVFAQLRL